ncbi:hypothetical protein BGZ94_006433, partial [Podila epigama]
RGSGARDEGAIAGRDVANSSEGDDDDEERPQQESEEGSEEVGAYEEVEQADGTESCQGQEQRMRHFREDKYILDSGHTWRG